MLRLFIRKLGTVWSTLSITLLSIVLSVSIDAVACLLRAGMPSFSFSLLVAAVIPALIAPPLAYTVFGLVKHLDESEYERTQLVVELQDALAKIDVLDGLLPICASCKKIRDETGQWQHIESYIRARSQAEFSHGLCPECAHELYAEYLVGEE
jgi:hypothetical protein